MSEAREKRLFVVESYTKDRNGDVMEISSHIVRATTAAKAQRHVSMVYKADAETVGKLMAGGISIEEAE